MAGVLVSLVSTSGSIVVTAVVFFNPRLVGFLGFVVTFWPYDLTKAFEDLERE